VDIEEFASACSTTIKLRRKCIGEYRKRVNHIRDYLQRNIDRIGTAAIAETLEQQAETLNEFSLRLLRDATRSLYDMELPEDDADIPEQLRVLAKKTVVQRTLIGAIPPARYAKHDWCKDPDLTKFESGKKRKFAAT